MKNGHALHIYFGECKGKTTAAMGLAIRAAGQGKIVLLCQFMKTNTTGELNSLKLIPNVHIVLGEPITKLTTMMTEQELADEKRRQRENFNKFCSEINHIRPDLIVMDELLVAESMDMVDSDKVLSCVDEWLETAEVVLTGRWASDELIEKADYVTEMVKRKHPFDQGIMARRGIEF